MSGAAITKAFEGLSSATVHEALGWVGALPPRIKPLVPTMRVLGPAFPVQCRPGDNLALHMALAEAPAGSVLVGAAQGDLGYGAWGEVLTVSAMARGLAGFVFDGSVRDFHETVGLGFPVFAAGLSIRGTVKSYRPDAIPAEVLIGDVAVRPGDLVLGDADGVVVVPRDRIADAPALSLARMKKEDDMMAALRAGKTTVELMGL
ncbi:MAG: RraA family protein [Afipia sp.]|nr:RraA family protein [Afipia sp.]